MANNAAALNTAQNFGPASINYSDNIAKGCIDILMISFADGSSTTKACKECQRVSSNTAISPQFP
ncbi:hypothetical protein D9619_013208 [Psilocybe cf. subviscida]|uniref:Uncharacterized protein n=1 Tax=Psilocybe cf. subviscida TaxID=2480587 RepID=A0A8H5B8C3_9AGAR|nr:hypothetical protein D9619_013208 [Psilocybe cf. subviscida]